MQRAGSYFHSYRQAALRLLLGILIMAALPSLLQNSAANAGKNAGPVTYVLLLNPECDGDLRDKFDYYMHLNNTAYEQRLRNYQVVCMGGVENLRDVETYIVPLLRQSFLDDTFVFVYSDSMKEQYYDYIENKFGLQYRFAALGNSDVPKGVAYASEMPANVKHEMAHLATCGTWHDADGKDMGRIVRHPQADQLSWCS